MNGRIYQDGTPEGRLAAVARSLALRMAEQKKEPDYADYRDTLRPFVKRELILARIEEARKSAGEMLTARVAELAKELAEVNNQIANTLQGPI